MWQMIQRIVRALFQQARPAPKGPPADPDVPPVTTWFKNTIGRGRPATGIKRRRPAGDYRGLWVSARMGLPIEHQIDPFYD